jgi:hypothetical protein
MAPPPFLLLFVQHYLPMQSVARAKWWPTLHGREQLFKYLAEQSAREEEWQQLINESNRPRHPERTVYMDGVSDLFHVGHLEAIRQCAACLRVTELQLLVPCERWTQLFVHARLL